MNTLVIQPETHLARTPKTLVPLIKEDLSSADESGTPYFRAAGEKLWEARTQIHFSDWTAWVKDNFSISKRTADRYMQFADHCAWVDVFKNQQDLSRSRATSRQPKRYKTLSDFAEPDRDKGHRPAWYSDVKEVVDGVNVARLKQEQQNKEKEKKLQRELGLKLINIGFKALVIKLHPDKGGSNEAMTRLNIVMARLKGAI